MTSGSSVTAPLIRSLPKMLAGRLLRYPPLRGLLAVASPCDLRAGRGAIATFYAGGSGALSPPRPVRLATPLWTNAFHGALHYLGDNEISRAITVTLTAARSF